MSAYLQPYLGLSFSQGLTTGLTTAAAVDPEPISKAILAIAATISRLFSFGYNPQKLNDTAITENVKIALNQIWYQVSGEDLGGGGGGGCNCTPGQCGKQHCAIFQGSAYPNVPAGPEGNPAADIEVAIYNAEQIVAEAGQHLVRQESLAGYDANADYMLGLLEQVAAARESNPFSGIDFRLPGAGAGISELPPWAPLAAIALGLWAIL